MQDKEDSTTFNDHNLHHNDETTQHSNYVENVVAIYTYLFAAYATEFLKVYACTGLLLVVLRILIM